MMLESFLNPDIDRASHTRSRIPSKMDASRPGDHERSVIVDRSMYVDLKMKGFQVVGKTPGSFVSKELMTWFSVW